MGWISCVGRHPLCALGRLPTAADRPYIAASVQQLGHDGTADGTRRAETTCQESSGSVIVMLLLAPIVPGRRASANSPVSTLCHGPHAAASTRSASGGNPVGRVAARTVPEQSYLGAATRVSARLTAVRLCRNECFIRAHIYTWTGILTHASSALPTIVVQPFDRSGRKSDRRLGALPADNLQAVTGAPDGPVLLSLPPIIARGVPQPDR